MISDGVVTADYYILNRSLIKEIKYIFERELQNCQASASRILDGSCSGSMEDVSLVVPNHPLGIKPLGNAFTASTNIKSAAGVFSNIPDEIIIQVLEFLHVKSLLRLGATCKALYAFCHFDEHWKALFIRFVIFTGLAIVRISIAR